MQKKGYGFTNPISAGLPPSFSAMLFRCITLWVKLMADKAFWPVNNRPFFFLNVFEVWSWHLAVPMAEIPRQLSFPLNLRYEN
jgi:hypothetical protein